MSLRAARRRDQREQQRRCLTVADIAGLNEQRRLPDDFPSMKNLKPELSQKRRELIAKDIETYSYDDTREQVALLAQSTELQAFTAELRSHPGPESRLHPLVLCTAVVFQTVKRGDCLRTEICKRINGFDSRLWHEYAMCDRHERTPVTYSVVEQQIRRIEKICGSSVDDVECDFWSRFSSELLGLSIPQARLDKATAVAVDQTAFPTHYRTTDFRRQADVDKAFKATGALPDGVIVDREGKMVRCKDPDARAGHRSASTAAGGKATAFVGYHVNEATLVKPTTRWSGRPKADPLIADDGGFPYVTSLSVVRASANPGPVCFDLVSSAQQVAPGINDVLADRGITNCTETFNRPLHQQNINVTMDYKNMPHTQINAATTMTLKWVDKRNVQLLYVGMDGLYPLWIPKRFLRFPKGLTKDAAREWFEARARFRWVLNSTRSNGRKQFYCPQHAGKVATSAKTRGRGRTPAKSVVTLPLDPEHEWCCEGSVMLDVEELDTFQQIPYGTTTHAKSYGRRNQIENVFSIARARGGFTPHSCRARGLGAHLISALALAIASNLHFARRDPLAEDPTGHANNDTRHSQDDHCDNRNDTAVSGGTTADNRNDTAVSGGTTADNRNGRRHRAPP